jgi:hypothetical protein
MSSTKQRDIKDAKKKENLNKAETAHHYTMFTSDYDGGEIL